MVLNRTQHAQEKSLYTASLHVEILSFPVFLLSMFWIRKIALKTVFKKKFKTDVKCLSHKHCVQVSVVNNISKSVLINCWLFYDKLQIL